MIKRVAKAVLDEVLERLLSRRARIKLGRHILNRPSGDNDADFRTNGELRVIESVRRKLHGRRAVVFDVGAHVGEWTRALVQGMGPELTVCCFEPCKATYEKLTEQLRPLKDVKITAELLALGRESRQASLFVARHLAGAHSLLRRTGVNLGDGPMGTEQVSVVPGDTYCAQGGIEAVDFVKIDTEGYEMEVLKGFERMLSERRIGCLQFEYGGTWIDARILLMDAFAWLIPKGYAIGKIHAKGVEVLGSYDQTVETFQYANFLAMREDWTGAFERIR